MAPDLTQMPAGIWNVAGGRTVNSGKLTQMPWLKDLQFIRLLTVETTHLQSKLLWRRP